MKDASRLFCDYLIVGSGIAGLFAALKAAPHGKVIVVTKRECEANIMARERRYLEVLQGVTAYHVWGSHLWLETGDGWALVFAAPAQ